MQAQTEKGFIFQLSAQNCPLFPQSLETARLLRPFFTSQHSGFFSWELFWARENVAWSGWSSATERTLLEIMWQCSLEPRGRIFISADRASLEQHSHGGEVASVQTPTHHWALSAWMAPSLPTDPPLSSIHDVGTVAPNRGCTRALHKCCCLGLTPRESDLDGLGRSLGILYVPLCLVLFCLKLPRRHWCAGRVENHWCRRTVFLSLVCRPLQSPVTRMKCRILSAAVFQICTFTNTPRSCQRHSYI